MLDNCFSNNEGFMFLVWSHVIFEDPSKPKILGVSSALLTLSILF